MRDIIIKTGKRKTTVSRAAIRKAVNDAYDKIRAGQVQEQVSNYTTQKKPS